MPKLSKAIKQKVAERANYVCEYCKYLQFYAPVQFDTDHIIPISLGGTDDLNNLANACGSCNGSKFTATTALDPVSGKTVSLYNPRIHNWNEHFIWSEDFIYMKGITPIGRATIIRLKTNNEGVTNFRSIALGKGHPPK